MPVLVGLLVIAGLVWLVATAGLAAERDRRVASVTRRLAPLTPAERGRVGLWLARDPRVPAPLRPLPLAAFMYWVAPFDLIPDFIPRIGYLDDRIVLAMTLWITLRTRGGAAAFEEHLARAEYLRAMADAHAEADDSAEGEQAPDDGGPPLV